MSKNARARATRKKALAVATTFGIAAGLCATTTGPATAAPAAPAATSATDEVVVPDPGRFAPRGEELFQTDATGYAHRQEGTAGYLWRDTSTGTEKAITERQALGHSGLFLTVEPDPELPLEHAKVADTSTGQQRLDVLVPNGLQITAAYNADTVLTAGRDDEQRYDSFQLLQVIDGKTVEHPVTGLSGTFDELQVLAQDSRGALIRTWQEGHLFEKDYVLDYETAMLKPTAMTGEGVVVHLGTEHIGYYDLVGNKVVTAPRSNPTATVQMPLSPQDSGEFVYAYVGDWILVVEKISPRSAPFNIGNMLYARRIGTNEFKELLPSASAQLTTAPDGSVLVVGGTSATDWAVHRVSTGTDGIPQLTRVTKVPQIPTHYAGIALGGGRLGYLSTDVPGADKLGLHYVETNLTATPPTADTPSLRARMTAPTSPGLISLGDGDLVYVNGKSLYVPPAGTLGSRAADLPVENAKVIDGAGRYVLAESGTTKYVADLENDGIAGTSDVRLTLTNSTAAALWDAKVWKPAAAPGQIDSYNLATGGTSAPVDLGSGCRPTELQAVGRWLYWACGADKSGVYDQTDKKNQPVPAGEALLGDGFIVRHVADELQLTNLTTGQTTTFADLAPSDVGSGRRDTWTVDKFGGGVAYVDAQKNIHVKKTGAAAQPLAPLTHTIGNLTFEGAGVEPSPATWSPVYRFSKPVGSWELTIRKGDGELIRRISGTRGDGATIRPHWDGKDSAGRGLETNQYRWELIARPLDGVGPAHGSSDAFIVRGSTYTTAPGSYAPVTPTRLLDTRSGLGAPKAKIGPLRTVPVKVAGRGGLPAEGVSSVVLNVTATNTTASGFVSAWPYLMPSFASSLNFKAGQTVANLVTVPVRDGYIELFNKSGEVDLLADVAGYYTDGASGSSYTPVAPQRLMDTRSGIGVPKAKVDGGRTVTLDIAEPGATAVALNLTATNATSTSYVSAYPYGATRPVVSSLNFGAGQTVPNMVVVPVKDGKVTFYNHYGSVDLIADVAGYFKRDTGSLFTGMQHKRLMDTRNGTGVPKAKVGTGGTVTLTVGTKYKAVVLNVTATNPTATGFVSVYPYGTARPSASNLNFVAGQTVANGVVVPVKDGKITFYNHSGTVDLIADVTGFYTS